MNNIMKYILYNIFTNLHKKNQIDYIKKNPLKKKKKCKKKNIKRFEN